MNTSSHNQRMGEGAAVATAMNIIRTSSAPAVLSPEQQNLAEELMDRHGNVRVSREANGTHFYIACPECLENDGEQELWKMHLALNADKWQRGQNSAAQCMKSGKVFEIDALTMWPKLEDRGYQKGPAKILDQVLVTEETHEADAQGRMVPKGAGETVLLTELPEDHPAIFYVRYRGFDPAKLVQQFGAAYCTKDRTDLKFRRLLNGFKASPFGRIVLHIYQKGIRVGWQARILDVEDDHSHYYYHPERNAWLAVAHRETPTSEWVEMEGWEDWDPVKYLMARGARRNSCIMGYDAAVQFNQQHRQGKKSYAFVSEGPLDAGRLGPPAVALCGKVCSEAQATLLHDAFETILVVPDNDSAGSKLMQYVGQWIGDKRQVVEVKVPSHRKDAGELTPTESSIFRTAALIRAGIL